MKHDYNKHLDQLITDENLISEVIRGEVDRERWLQYLKEKQLPESLLNQAIERIKDLNAAFPSNKLSETRKKEIYNKIEAGIDQESNKSPLSIARTKVRPWLVAASFLFCIGVAYFLFTNSNLEKVNTALVESEKINLQDGSFAFVAPDSEIKWNGKEFNKERKVELEGEAFFEVEKGGSFEVSSRWGTVKVLGTSFNILDREERYEVVCRTGKVKVNTRDGEEYMLTSGMMAYYDPSTKESGLREIGAVETSLWIDGSKYLHDVSMTELATELKRQFAVDLEVSKELENRKGNFMLNLNSLDSSLYQISWPLRAEIEKIGERNYRITEKQ